MKFNKIKLSFLAMCIIVGYMAITSYSTGITGLSQAGCSCHGPNTGNTLISITGLPTDYIPGTTYTLTANVNNPGMSKAGIDLTATLGTLGGTPSGATVTSTEINHTTPALMSGGIASWTFNWTAPTTGSGIAAIYIAGNAVNGDFGTGGDGPNIDSFFIPENIPTLGCSAIVNPPLCATGTGTVTGTATGGTPAYTYSLTSVGSNASGVFVGVPAGIYSLIVTDLGGLSCTTSVVVNPPAPLNVFTTNCANILCFGASTGYTGGSASGGTPPYTYLWAPSGATTAGNPGIPAGTHTITITDANGCVAAANCTITQPPAITNSIIVSASGSYVLPGTSTTVTTTGAYPHIYLAANGCDSTVTYNVTIISSTCVNVSAKVLLHGAHIPGTTTMRDNLRTLSSFPLTEPYSTLNTSLNAYSGVYNHLSGGGETTTPAVLAVTGPNAIVDWVFLTIRLATTSAVTATRAALLQVDGDVVDIDGVSPVCFNAPAGNYHVSVKHRNHLGCLTNNTFALSSTTTVVDFTSPATPMWLRPYPFDNAGPLSGARKNVGTLSLLYAGNCRVSPTLNNKFISYGASGWSDRTKLLSHTGFFGTIPGYTSIDCNMNGVARYNFAGNDRLVISGTCLGSSSIFVYEQIP